jgi:PleD family two-component response regulator
MNRNGALKRSDAIAPSFAPTVVLIADPDAETRALYREAFICAYCDVVEATDGRDALAKALPRPPSLVITELTLPFVNGYALCNILRHDPLTAAVPILVVTSPTLRNGPMASPSMRCCSSRSRLKASSVKRDGSSPCRER